MLQGNALPSSLGTPHNFCSGSVDDVVGISSQEAKERFCLSRGQFRIDLRLFWLRRIKFTAQAAIDTTSPEQADQAQVHRCIKR